VIERPNHVWSTDITYIPMRGGFLYLVAVMDWFSRYVLSWELSNTLETSFCLAALHAAFRFGQPEIWNSDQGSQFTSADFLAPLKKRGISISMNGRGRALDNVFIERLWRSLKYELILRTAEISNWTGKAVAAPRTELDELLGCVHTIRSASTMSAKQRNARKTTSSFSKREKIRRKPFSLRKSRSISLRFL
jgi:transposase InsO family protein